jgi:hypothetical protein
MKTIKNGPEAQAGKCHKFLNTYKPVFRMKFNSSPINASDKLDDQRNNNSHFHVILFPKIIVKSGLYVFKNL